MLDLETLSTRANAAIIVIGAIKFKEDDIFNERINEKDLYKMDTFYRRIKIETYFEENNKKKYDINEDTVSWWESQAKDIKYEAFLNPDRVTLKEALQEFVKWVGDDKKNVKIWGNGSSFDVTILTETFFLEEIEPCWNFWLVRDLRTLMELGNVRMKDLPEVNKHHALWDCYRQIIGFHRSMQNLKN